MLPNPPKCIRALTSVILFQGTIVPASNSNPVCLGGKVTASINDNLNIYSSYSGQLSFNTIVLFFNVCEVNCS